MKLNLILLLCINLILLSCDEKEIRTLNGTWKLVHHYNVATGAVELIQGADKGVILTFSDDGKLGTISGDSVNNPVLGIYELGPHSKISITSFGLVKTTDEWSDVVIDRITSADYVKVSPNTLNLSCNQGREVLLFVREN